MTKLIEDGHQLVWHIVVSVWDDGLLQHLFPLEERFRSSIHIYEQSGVGIYQAINQGISHVQGDYFVIVGSGDVLFDNLWDHLPNLDKELVHCFESNWHDTEGNTIRLHRVLPFAPLLGRMPDHHSMIFPRSFSTMEYECRFLIAADQYLKLQLWRQHKLARHSEVIGSSLIGGITTRPLPFREVFSRYVESRQILRESFNGVWAETAAMTYLALFLGKFLFVRNARASKVDV